jgi:fibro-slime domain-containing protein
LEFLTNNKKDVDYPNELNESDPPDDPFLFTIHWETTFTVNHMIDPINPPSVIFEVTSDDDFWLFVNDQLINGVDLGGIHGRFTKSATVTPPLLRVGLNSLDIFYAERHEIDGYLKLVIEPGPSTWVTINDPSHICAKKSVEDLLKHQEERIKRFEDRLEIYSAVESEF